MDKEIMTKIKLGEYEHYKGKRYKVIGVARHSETLEELVVYQALYGENGLWVRPLEMFFENVEINGKQTPRFKYLNKESVGNYNIDNK